MTIASQTSRISYTGNGSTTAFAVPFYFAADADLAVYVRSTGGVATLQTLGTNYTLTGATLAAGGTCTFVTAPTTGYTVVIYRDPALTQTTSYNDNDPFPASSHERALDKAVTIDQRTRDMGVRAVHLDDGDSTATMTVPTLEIRKGKVAGYSASDGSLTVSNNTIATLDSVLSGALATSGGLNRIVLTDTYSTLRALTPIAGQVVYMGGYNTVGDGGAGIFHWSASSTATHDAGVVIQPGAGGIGRWLRDVTGQPMNPRWFGATGDGVTDDTTALTNLVTAALAASRPIYIPTGTYLYSSLPNITKMISIYGDGPLLSRLVYSGAAVALKIVPPTDSSNNIKQTLRDFSIDPSVDAAGTYGIHVSLAAAAPACYYAYFDWKNVWVGNFGTRSAYLDNNISNTDGFFDGVIEDCSFAAAFLGVNIGDNISFIRPKMRGSKEFFLSAVSGARGVLVSEGSITNTGGCFFQGVNGFRYIYNHQEIPTNYTGSGAAALLFYGATVGTPAGNITVTGNRISALGATKPTVTIYFAGYVNKAQVDQNEITKGATQHIQADANTQLIKCSRIDYDVSAANADSGTNNNVLSGTTW